MTLPEPVSAEVVPVARFLPHPRARPARPLRVVALGGGTGLPVLLRGLARQVRPRQGRAGVELTAVVAMSDDGGSSGRLRRTRGLLPPGDVRNCLVALAASRGALTDVLQHRFGGRGSLAGHALGNLVLAALTEMHGDFLRAIRSASRLLETRGTVLPSTLDPVQLVAELEDGRRLVGERHLARSGTRVRRVFLHPARPAPADGVLEAIASADLVTLGPGSLYSSVLPNLLVDGVAEALRVTRARRVLVANLMTEPGETVGMGAVDHVRAVLEHAGPVVDVVLLNSAPLGASRLERYAHAGAEPVRSDLERLRALGVVPLEADLLGVGPRLRHDARKLGKALLSVTSGQG
ncbi:MAG TPA: gluconeogenesis factor YvcK family protein [Myxococcaceae bacterium]|nr:gluconeogenesis factor YvcK family protein [Myxococcaceae bacterium]